MIAYKTIMKALLVLTLSLFSYLSLAQEITPLWSKLDSVVGIITYSQTGKGVCSGIALNPKVVLTSAHCLVNSEKVRILLKKEISTFDFMGLSKGYNSKTWKVHPQYSGATFNSIDLGLIFLDGELPNDLNFPTLEEASKVGLHLNLPLERLGIGMREGKNKMTWINVFFSKFDQDVFQTYDQYGFAGDSGGPVLFRSHDDYVLVGIHAGKVIDTEGNPIDYSYAIPVKDHYQWIKNTIQELIQD